MVVKKKKIGYYQITFKNVQGRYFDSKRFINFIETLQRMPLTDRQKNYIDRDKAVNLDIIELRNNGIYHLVFKSCKYNYSPNYMSSRDGSERESDKRMDEGDKVLTHACMKIEKDGAYIALEQSKFGVQYSLLNDYFQHYLEKIDSRIKIEIAILADKDIQEIINGARRIVSIDVESDFKNIVNDEYQELLSQEDALKTEVNFSIRAERGQSLSKPLARIMIDRRNEFIGGGTKRIRIYIKDEKNMDVLIDTWLDNIKDSVSVMINRDGTVDSDYILFMIEKLLQEKQFSHRESE
jgi:hypothetical protein